MTEHNQISLPDEVLNTILTDSLEGLPAAVSLLINHAMLIERHRHLGAAPYERAPARNFSEPAGCALPKKNTVPRTGRRL